MSVALEPMYRMRLGVGAPGPGNLLVEHSHRRCDKDVTPLALVVRAGSALLVARLPSGVQRDTEHGRRNPSGAHALRAFALLGGVCGRRLARAVSDAEIMR